MDYPRPQDVAPGVAWFAARTPTLPPATHTNSYAIGTRQLLLVEPATPYEDEIAASDEVLIRRPYTCSPVLALSRQ